MKVESTVNETPAPHPQTQQVTSNVNNIPGADFCGIYGPTQYKHTKSHQAIRAIFIGSGGWLVLQSIALLSLEISQDKETLFPHIFYGSLMIDFGNGALTIACGILIDLAVKSRQVSRLKLPLSLELIAAILMMFGFGLMVYRHNVYKKLAAFALIWLVLPAIFYGSEGVCYIVHIILGVTEIKEWKKRVEISQQNPENTVIYLNIP